MRDLFTLLLLLSSLDSFTQKSEVYNVEELRLKTIYLKDQSSKDTLRTGSAFILHYKDRFFLFTAQHVAHGLSAASTIAIPVRKSELAEVKLSSLSKNGSDWKYHPSADVAALELKASSIVKTSMLRVASIHADLMTTQQDSFPAHVEVVMFGYPVLDRAKRIFTPHAFVTRIAGQVFQEQLQIHGKIYIADFLYLGSSMVPGMSGGPVLVGVKTSSSPRQTSTKLIGLLNAHPPEIANSTSVALVLPPYYIDELLRLF